MIKPSPKNMDGALLTESINCDNALIYMHFQDKEVAFYLRAGKLLSVFSKGEGLPVGTVCIGKIAEIKKDINACFLLLKDRQKCFMHLSEAESAVNFSRAGSGANPSEAESGANPSEKASGVKGPDRKAPVKCGDNLLIEISKEPSKGKPASAKAFAASEPLIRDARTRTDFSIIRKGEDYIDSSLRFANFIKKAYHDEGTVRILTDCDSLIPVLNEHIKIYLSGEYPEASFETGSEARFASPDYASFLAAPKLYEDALVSLKVLYGLESKVREALGRKVWLSSGAYITIENTEAMTVIDVNSAKSSAKQSESDHYYTVNAEAADEIVRQIVLRNLSGIIVVDFINMKSKDLQNDIIDRIRNHPLNREESLHVYGFTKLGLLELTRRKTGHPLTEMLTL
ncbi:MAG: ribonuclease E/G [Lachnospiraceae bacterium]|nr:ribonuclease E/G [Lachnospiraceae bacterium]